LKFYLEGIESAMANFQDSYIEALEKLRDVLTPHGIQMPSVEKIELDTVREHDAMALAMNMPVGSVALVTATLYVPLAKWESGS
jgi:hypothetical protein